MVCGISLPVLSGARHAARPAPHPAIGDGKASLSAPRAVQIAMHSIRGNANRNPRLDAIPARSTETQADTPALNLSKQDRPTGALQAAPSWDTCRRVWNPC